MEELFEKYLGDVCKDYEKKWYEVFDGDLFYIVEGKIMDDIFEGDYNAMINNTDYRNWIKEMSSDL